MNNVCICVGKRANSPFTPKFSEFSLYSIEELCYYFIERCYVIQEDIVSLELVKWIREECGLKELADTIEVDVRKKGSPSLLVGTILEYTGIYDSETVEKTERIIREQSLLKPYERMKNRGDYYYQMGRFRQAQEVYFFLLNSLSDDEYEKKAILLYDIASLFAMDFSYEKACEFYEKSYSLKPLMQTRVAYISACRMKMTDYEYGIFMRENPQWGNEFEIVDRQFNDTQAMWVKSHTKELCDEVSHNGEKKRELIRNLKKDYRRQIYLHM